MHQGMELPPAVVVGVEEKGLEEEQQDVREKGRGEHAHQVVRELRIQDDEHERQGRSEGRGEREGDGEELRELVREPVVSQISGLVADRLDDEREDGDGKDERREQQVQLRDHPDGDAAPDDGNRPVLGLLVGLLARALFCRVGFSPACPAAGGRLARSRTGGGGSLNSRRRPRPSSRLPANITRRGDGTEKDQQFAVRHGIRHSMAATGATRGALPDRLRRRADRTDAADGRLRRGSGPMGRAPGRWRTGAQAASPRWNCDATSSPLQSIRAQGTIEIRGRGRDITHELGRGSSARASRIASDNVLDSGSHRAYEDTLGDSDGVVPNLDPFVAEATAAPTRAMPG